MKNLLLLALLAIFSTTYAQDCFNYYPVEEGEKFTVKTFDKKDRLQSRAEYEVMDASANKVTYHAVLFDDDDEELGTFDFDILCENGKVKVDMQSMMTMDMLERMQSEGMEMEIESDYVEYPIEDLTVGMELPDASMSMKMFMEGMSSPMLTVSSKMYDRKVEGTETVEVEGESYNCYKITGTTDVKMGFINSTSSSANYISKDAGYVKTETFDKKGKLESYTIVIRE